jgi:hypothetical protein
MKGNNAIEINSLELEKMATKQADGISDITPDQYRYSKGTFTDPASDNVTG